MVSVGVIKVQCDACKEVIKGKYIHFSDGSIFCSECFQYLPKCIGCKKPIIGGEDESTDGLCNICYKRTPKCNICGKAIIGTYTRFTDKSISCDNCMKRYQKCDRCGKPVVMYTSIRSKILCKYCLTFADRCTVCSNPIIGSHWVFDEEKVCDHCYRVYDRCDLCGIPSQFVFTVHDKKLCYSCQENAKKCTACGLPIIGKYYSYKHKEGIYCEHCETLSPHCDSCGRPVGMQYIMISDGRKICNECQRTAITTEKQLNQLIKTAIKGLNELGLEIKNQINYRLISKKLLDHKIAESGAAVTAGRNLGLFQRKDNKMKIYLQSHLPIQMALSTLAHELGHAWQSENLINKVQSLSLREGFCEWVAYKIVKRFGYHGQADLILSRDDSYGLGFQKFLEFEKKNSIESLIEHAKNAKN